MPCARSSRPARLRGDGVAGPVRLRVERLRQRGAPGVSKRSCTATCWSFLRLAPAYGGSLVERAPFALLPGLWGGGALAVYRMVALPCLLAAAVLGVWLCARMRAQGHSTLARAVALGVCVANPITLRALELGHPEELLGACLCVAAVLLARRCPIGRDHSLLAGAAAGAGDRQQGVGAAGRRPGAARAAARAQGAMPGERLHRRGAVVLAPLALVACGRLRGEHPRARPRRRRARSSSRGRCGGSSATTVRSCTGCSGRPSPATGSGRPGRARSATR